MTVQIMGGGNQGPVTWTIDYHDAAEAVQPQTIGFTADSAVPVHLFTLKLTIIATSKVYLLNATPWLNQGRTVLGGAGSVVGEPAPVTSAPLPGPRGSPNYIIEAGVAL